MADNLTRLESILFDRYRIERELGAGGMATVYLAHDVKHDRQVAIKVLRQELGASVGPERFLAEIKTTAKLQHPHILPLLDSGSAGGRLYYVMPFVEGESLRARLTREQQLPVEEMVRLTREIADALQYAHERGIVHRDIKPENILLLAGHALVADFGIALALETAGGERLTQSGVSIGTPQYMSPEQAMGERGVDARTDQYALGAVAYEMLVGAPPFTGPTAQVIVARKLTESPPPISGVRPAAGRTLDHVIRRALATVPADRFESLAAFTAALHAASAESTAQEAGTLLAAPGSGGSVGARERTRFRWSRWRLGGAAVAALALVAVGATLWRKSSTPDAAPLLRVNIPTGALAMLGHAKASVVAISPDGRTLAYVAGTGSEGQLMLRRLDAATPTPVPGAESAFSPFFSPDGQWLGYVDASPGVQRARLKKRHLQDGRVFDLSPALGMHGAAWTKDGRIILGGTRGSDWGLSIVSADGGEPQLLLARDSVAGDGYLVWPTLTPDGRHLVFTRLFGNGQPRSLELLDLESGEVRRLLETRDALDGGGNAIVTSDGVVVYAADGALFGAELDVSRGRLRSAPVKLVPDVLMGVRLEPALGHFALGRDGTLVYVAGGSQSLGDAALWVRWDDSVRATRVGYARAPDADGGEMLDMRGARLIPGTDRWVFAAPAVTKDVRALYWWLSEELWEGKLGAERARRIAAPRAYNPVPSWDGAWIFFNRIPVDRYTSPLYRQRRDGGAPEQLTPEQPGVLAAPYSVTRDGKLLLYIQTDTLTPPANADVYALPLDGDRKPRPVLVGPGADYHPAISPDGKWLAWASGTLLESRVFVAPFPTLAPRRQVTTTRSLQPAWSEDGATLYYFEGTPPRVQCVAFVGGPDLRLGTPRACSGTSTFSGGNIRLRSFDVDRKGRVYSPSLDVGQDTLLTRDLAVFANWGVTLRAAVRK